MTDAGMANPPGKEWCQKKTARSSLTAAGTSRRSEADRTPRGSGRRGEGISALQFYSQAKRPFQAFVTARFLSIDHYYQNSWCLSTKKPKMLVILK
jgi:hypothetical protein